MEDKVLMVMGEMYIGLTPAPLPPITQVILLYCWVFLFMFMIEVDIGLRTAITIHITMVDYKFSTKGSLKKLFQGV